MYCVTLHCCIFIWILSWTSTPSGGATIVSKFQNSTVLRGSFIELEVVNFTLASNEQILSLRCKVQPSQYLVYYDLQRKEFKVQSSLPALYAERISLSNLTIIIRSIDFSDENSKFTCELHYSFNGEPLTMEGEVHELKEVQEPPSVTGTPLPSVVTVSVNEEANITCEFVGKPEPNVSWTGDITRLRQTSLSSRKNGTYLTIVTTVLHLRDLQPSHNGVEGGCMAQNSAGVAKQSLKLNVTYAPTNTTLTIKPNSAEEGQLVTVECSSVGNPPVLFFNITRNGKSINMSSTGKYMFLSQRCSEESGTYACIPMNSVGYGERKEENLTVYGPPKIVAFQESVTVNESHRLELVCNASGCPQPIYSWTKESTVISTNAVYTIHIVQPDDAGTYKCNASNYRNSAVKEITVTVNYQPRNVSLSSSGANGVVREGTRLVINCSALGYPLVKYRLRFNGTLLNGTSDGVYIRESASCRDDTGTYTCEAYNDLGTAPEKLISVSVERIPAFTQVPVSRTVNESNPVSFSCEAMGCPLPVVGFRKIRGSFLEVRNTLTINSAKLEDAGTYVCDANSSIGSNMTFFTLAVQYPARNASLQAPSQAIFNNSVTLRCISSSVPAPSYAFYKITSELGKSIVSPESNGENGVLVIPQIRHNNSTDFKAVYRCAASNLLGSVDSLDTSITILVPPMHISANPAKVTVNETEGFSVACSVSEANPPANFTWTLPSTSVLPSSSLVVMNASRSHSGDYICTASNGIPPAATITVAVIVQYAPSVSPSVPSAVSTCVGQTITLSCVGDGNPTPRVKLLKGNELASGVGHVQYVVSIKSTSFGNYNCVVTNFLGQMEKIITVVKQDTPGPPMSLTVEASGTSLILRWSQPQCLGTFALKQYLIYYKKGNEPNFTSISKECMDHNCRYELAGLDAETEYNIAIAVVDVRGRVGTLTSVDSLPKTGKRAAPTDDKIPIYAGAAGGAVLLILIIVVVIIIYRGRKRGQVNPREPVDIIVEQSTSDKVVVNIKAARSDFSDAAGIDGKPHAGRSMYDGDASYKSSFGNGAHANQKRSSEREAGSIDSSQSKGSSAAYKGKKTKGAKSNGVPQSPAFVRGETNNSFLADSDGAYEPAGKYIAGQSKPDLPTGYYASVHKPSKRSYADLAELRPASPPNEAHKGQTVDSYLRTNYAELVDLGPLTDAKFSTDGPNGPVARGADNHGYQEINEL